MASSLSSGGGESRPPPVHPGEVLADELAELGISVAALARALDIPMLSMAEIVQGKRSVTADTALRLATHFGTSARIWVNLQAAYDLARTRAA